MPGTSLATTPVPSPAFTTVRRTLAPAKAASTERASLMVTVQLPVPLQPDPLQPANVEPAAGCAVSVTTVPLSKLAVQAPPQEMPAGALLTVPVPPPERVTVSGNER